MQNKKLPGVGVAVIIRKNNVLLGKRIGSHGEGTWQFPGGHLEFNEKLEDCAKREALEETNLKVKEIKFAAITNDLFKHENKHYITIFMVADYNSGKETIMEPKKCLEWKWFAWNKFPQPIFLPCQNLLKQNFNPFQT
ncbi:DNA mismatch repair protein MutT [Candidatus Roizmanbacteria bacterium RIFCSPHIGHO2_01_FULL_39_8]|uniref:DNA mismatch repair protein MutT n=3 Tax=Candidatus Roizmaniibacteriota TaxID=1752723 RepID=A0A1F7GHT5_9BACT|nr:MAG: DNA mismatch repair protein MutT [Candidatus Roizmanbacteria bacterium RIFCSPHIGHO2_01_FULL_39_8]OGK27555.1 MAG: DNA mismatch repair protein MutT [Candidatus Roizmanbacteria bacterium RIFCSPHIGHO2_02_FULL_39_9]OGK37495.1 MAG: DNA mismatch repair protein MutT [Candidatus Roizmanbacteria bacterium RIFCSPHIGHO2_12_FULL_39_8]